MRPTRVGNDPEVGNDRISARKIMRTTAFPATDDSALLESSHFAGGPHFEPLRGFETGSRRLPVGAYTAAEVAALSEERILGMTRRELIDVIRSVRGDHLRPGIYERLPQMDAETLRRLVFLTRRYCRNQERIAEDARAGLAFSCGCG